MYLTAGNIYYNNRKFYLEAYEFNFPMVILKLSVLLLIFPALILNFPVFILIFSMFIAFFPIVILEFLLL